jgi:diaminopimelate epimerase
MQGLGNDYVYVNCFEETVPDPGKTAKTVSDRHFGVGSDGLVLIKPSEKADFQMDMYNSDGSRAEMCGNAIRCVGKFVFDRGMTDKKTVTIETLAGVKTLELDTEGGRVKNVTVDMGAPELLPKNIPVLAEGETFIARPVTVDGESYLVTCVSMGNPHAVIFMKGIDGLDLEKIGPKFENHPLFPRRINTEFVEVLDGKNLKMRVWERGAGETLACGTGACATLVAAVLNQKAEDAANVRLRGGILKIKWDRKKNTVLMTGPAEFVFDGEMKI